MFQITEHNVQTGEIIVRDATPDEIEQRRLDIENARKADEMSESNAQKKLQLLEKLGLTEEEAKLLLG